MIFDARFMKSISSLMSVFVFVDRDQSIVKLLLDSCIGLLDTQQFPEVTTRLLVATILQYSRYNY